MGKANRTRRQKKTLRNYAIGLSTCVIAATILVTASLVNRQEHIPVVFSDILDGATVVSGTENIEISEIITDEDYLYERMYEFETVILTTTPSFFDRDTSESVEETYGAGGVLLIDTTSTTTVPPETTTKPVTTTTQEVVTTPFTTTSEVNTETTTSRVTTKDTTTTKVSIATSKTTTKAITKETTTTKKTTTTKATTKKTTTTAKTTPKTSGTSKTPFTNIGGGVISDDDEIYIKMLNLVNEAREEAGLNKLWYSARVHEVSTQRAYELSSYYSHTREDGRGFHTAFIDNGISYKLVGENIAYGRNMFKTPEEVFQAWMDSESHRDNILHPDFECVGFGLSTLKIGKDTYYYWSQEFAKF